MEPLPLSVDRHGAALHKARRVDTERYRPVENCRIPIQGSKRKHLPENQIRGNNND